MGCLACDQRDALINDLDNENDRLRSEREDYQTRALRAESHVSMLLSMLCAEIEDLRKDALLVERDKRMGEG